MQVVVQPLPGIHLLHRQTRLTVSQGSEVQERPDDNGQNGGGGSPGSEQVLSGDAFANGLAALFLGLLGIGGDGGALADVVDACGFDVEDELYERTCDERRGEMSGQVVVQEELASHDEERNVVSCPGKEEETGRIIETRARACLLVSFSSFKGWVTTAGAYADPKRQRYGAARADLRQ